MSLTGDRQELADTLSTVSDVKGHQYRPASMKAGDAWPLLEYLDTPEAGAFIAQWRIAVILPPDERKASEWFDAHHEPLADALGDVGYVDRIEPGLVATEAGDLQAMFLIVRREA